MEGEGYLCMRLCVWIIGGPEFFFILLHNADRNVVKRI
jgi:hypothetical protein